LRTGYIIVSSQGNDQYAVYSTSGNNHSLGPFREAGVGVEDVSGSDGLAVTNRAVGKYSEGIFVSHDEPESGEGIDPDRDPTNFSYVSWGSVAKALKLKVDTTVDNDPSFGDRAR
jgi:3-phytase